MKKNRNKKLYILVALGHIAVLILLFTVFYFDIFSKPKKPASITVSIVDSNSTFSEKISTTTVKKTSPKIAKPITVKKTVVKKPMQKKVWKALDPSQILKSSEIVKKTVTKRTVRPIKTTGKNISESIRNSLRDVKFRSLSGTPSSLMNDYYSTVKGELYSLWQQPSRASVGFSNPVATITITINFDGTVSKAEILHRSGNAVMDRSVQELLSSLGKFPPPPNGTTTIEADILLTD